jgi:hypothetical protein
MSREQCCLLCCMGHVYCIAFCQSGSCNTRVVIPNKCAHVAACANSHRLSPAYSVRHPAAKFLFPFSLLPLYSFFSPIYPFLSPFILALPHTLFFLLHLTLFHIYSIDTDQRIYVFHLRILQRKSNNDAI